MWNTPRYRCKCNPMRWHSFLAFKRNGTFSAKRCKSIHDRTTPWLPSLNQASEAKKNEAIMKLPPFSTIFSNLAGAQVGPYRTRAVASSISPGSFSLTWKNKGAKAQTRRSKRGTCEPRLPCCAKKVSIEMNNKKWCLQKRSHQTRLKSQSEKWACQPFTLFLRVTHVFDIENQRKQHSSCKAQTPSLKHHKIIESWICKDSQFPK